MMFVEIIMCVFQVLTLIIFLKQATSNVSNIGYWGLKA